MERITRKLEPWLALTWGTLGAGVWAFNAVDAVTSDAEPSLDAVLVALALTVTGVIIGITLHVVIGLLWSERFPATATYVRAPWMLLMGLGLLGLVAVPLFSSTLTTIDWVLLVGGSLTSGFILGTVLAAPTRRLEGTESTPLSPSRTIEHH